MTTVAATRTRHSTPSVGAWPRAGHNPDGLRRDPHATAMAPVGCLPIAARRLNPQAALRWIDVNDVVFDALARCRGEMLTHAVSLTTDLAADLPSIEADPIQLRQLVRDLIRNGIDAMSGIDNRTRNLRISTDVALRNYVRVVVADSGADLDRRGAGQLFECFHAGKPSRMASGLTICRSIIEVHGGRISASSNQPHGAVFRFTLPRQRPDKAAS